MNLLNQGYEIKKGEYTLVWLKDSPKYDKRVKLPTVRDLLREVHEIIDRLLYYWPKNV